MRFSRMISMLGACGIAFAIAGCGGGEKSASSSADGAQEEQVVLHFNIDPIGKALELNKQMAKEYEEETGVKVEVIVGPIEATERLSQYLQFMGANSPDVDIYQVDVIWPGLLADHLIDLKPYFEGELDSFFQPIVKNNTVDGRLVAIPWFGDAGLLYYRTDLLEKYGYENPPKTWDELEEMAKKVQEGEREAGNPDFWGYVWQGKAFECLTCDGIEWIASHGGGYIVEPDGTVSINNPKAIAAVDRAAKWVGTISPPGVTSYAEEESRQLFQTGNALFMRNWPYAYALGNGEDSAIKGKFNVTVLPSGGAGNAAALGGWQLGISKYSEHPDEAAAFVKWITSREAQKRRAIEAGLLATRVELYDDAEIAEEIPFFPAMKDVFLNASPRPSTVTGEDYNEVSTIFFQTAHKALTGQKSAADALAETEEKLNDLLH